MNNIEKKDRFFGYFIDEFHACSELESRLFKKTLIVVMLDTLSRSRYPEYKNRERFVGLIRNYADWAEYKCVSLPQLSLEFKDSKISDSKLAQDVGIQLSNWNEDKVYKAQNDPNIDEILSESLKAKEKDLLKRCQYVELLYTYRNNLIHEFREPGHGMEDINDDKPCITQWIR